MLEKLKHTLRIVFFVHLGLGAVGLIALILTSPDVIGVGQVDALTAALETLNFKWWLVGGLMTAWLLPIVLVVIYRRAKTAGLEVAKLRAMVGKLVEGSAIPIVVDIDNDVPVSFQQSLRVPVQLDTHIDIDQEMQVQTEVPVETELPLDTTITTNVLGLGEIRIPIKARLPLSLVVPVNGALRVTAKGVPISIDEEATVRLPTISVPLRCRIETQIDILSNLKAAGKRLAGKAALPSE